MLQSVFKQVMDKAGINKKVGINCLRHSFATHLLEHGTYISLIQELLGHNDIKATLLYAHVSKKEIQQVKSPLDVINKPATK
jgi:integrase/recombinase XerD